MQNIYVFYGEERVLKVEMLTEIKKQKFGEAVPNLIKYDWPQVTFATIIETAASLSLFATPKVIIVKNCTFLTSDPEVDVSTFELNQFLKDLNNCQPEVIIILDTEAEKLDQRKRIVKDLKKKAIIKEFKPLSTLELIKYSQNKIKANGFQATTAVLNLLIDYTNNNLEFLLNELEKLMLYKAETKLITKADILELTPLNIFDTIFDLTNAVINKELGQALSLYQELLNKGEEPVKIIVTLANQFRLIYQTKKLRELGYSENQIATKLKVHPYRIKLATKIKGKPLLLLNYLESLADLDLKIKTGEIEKGLGLELFFLELEQK